jgi:RNA polymerase sigma factor (TIGR02999 family)
MSAAQARDVTALLMEWQHGDAVALERLMPVVYGELQRLAASYLRGERLGHTLQPTALIHEAYLRLVSQKTPHFRNRSHFYGVAAHLMRQILVDSARSRNAQKRGTGERVNLDDVVASSPERPHDIVALDEALSELAKVDDRKCRVIEMRYFGGLTNEEIAEAVGVSVPTVVRDTRFAEAWLRQHLGEAS